MRELISLLTRERVLIERMLYRAANMRNLLVGGQARFLAWAADEFEAAAEAVRLIGLNRDTCYQYLADAHDLPPTFDWDALLAHAGDTDATLLGSLRTDIASLLSELRGYMAACRELSELGAGSAAAALASLQGVDLSVTTTAPAIDARRHLDQTL